MDASPISAMRRLYRNFQDIDEFQEVVDELIIREQREGRRRFQGELPLPLGDNGSSEDR